MRTDTAPTIFRQDYAPYPYRLPQVRLEFDLAAESTRVRSELRFEPAPDTAPGTPLVLQGEDLELVEVRLDGRPLAADEYQMGDGTLSLMVGGDAAVLERAAPVLRVFARTMTLAGAVGA